MIKSFLLSVMVGSVAVFGLTASAVEITVGPWTPLYQGVDLASGQQAPSSGEFNVPNHRVLCLRIDLSDPDIRLFTTPKCTNCSVYDTLAENTSLFLEEHG